MNDKISHIAKMLGLTTQAIRLYEEKGVLRTPRKEESGYRVLSRGHITTLLRCRLLRSYGFSVPEIAAMLNDQNEEEVLEQYRAKRQELRAEIVRLQALEERLEMLERITREAVENAGTCRLDLSPAHYCLPFIDRSTKGRGLDADATQSWNELYPFRFDTVSIDRRTLLTDERKYRVLAVVEEQYLPLIPEALREGLVHRPAQKAVIAWYRWEESLSAPMQQGVGFALDYIRGEGLRLCGDATFTALLLLDRAGDTRTYFRAALPVE